MLLKGMSQYHLTFEREHSYTFPAWNYHYIYDSYKVKFKIWDYSLTNVNEHGKKKALLLMGAWQTGEWKEVGWNRRPGSSEPTVLLIGWCPESHRAVNPWMSLREMSKQKQVKRKRREKQLFKVWSCFVFLISYKQQPSAKSSYDNVTETC